MRSAILGGCYILFGVVDLLLLLFVRSARRREVCPSRTVQGACMLFVVTVLAFIICISVFPYPEWPGIFYTMGYAMAIFLFSFPYFTMAAVLTGTSVIYAILVMVFKPPRAAGYDLFAAVTIWILGYFFLYVITDLRLRDGRSWSGWSRSTAPTV